VGVLCRLVEEEEETVPVVVRSVDGFVSTDPKTPTTLTLHTHDGTHTQNTALLVSLPSSQSSCHTYILLDPCFLSV
jgi:hypothetical protein